MACSDSCTLSASSGPRRPLLRRRRHRRHHRRRLHRPSLRHRLSRELGLLPRDEEMRLIRERPRVASAPQSLQC